MSRHGRSHTLAEVFPSGGRRGLRPLRNPPRQRHSHTLAEVFPPGVEGGFAPFEVPRAGLRTWDPSLRSGGGLYVGSLRYAQDDTRVRGDRGARAMALTCALG